MMYPHKDPVEVIAADEDNNRYNQLLEKLNDIGLDLETMASMNGRTQVMSYSVRLTEHGATVNVVRKTTRYIDRRGF